MYPALLLPLGIAAAVAVLGTLLLALLRPTLRRLAWRMAARRPVEGMMVVAGALLGTALIVASLTVGDSFNRSVRQTAYDVLGPIDEYVRTSDPVVAAAIRTRLEPVLTDSSVDGVLDASGAPAAAITLGQSGTRSEPRALAWDVRYPEASRFGGTGSGLDIDDPGPTGVVLNRSLADALGARPGDRITLYLFGTPHQFTVRRIVPASGLAGMGIGASENRNAFLSYGTLNQLAAQAHQVGAFHLLLVSNRGGVESGVKLTDQVEQAIRARLTGLDASTYQIETPKREVLDAAKQAGDQLGSLFLFIASFSIIAGLMLIVLIFVMLGGERRVQLGMLRALGLRRRRIVVLFGIEGALYAAVGALLGAGVGLLVGRAVVLIAMSIINQFNSSDNQLAVTFAATRTSIVIGTSAGFLAALGAAVAISARLARLNIIGAIRDLDVPLAAPARRRFFMVSVIATAIFAALSVPALVAANGPATYLMPSLMLVSCVGWLIRWLPARVVHTSIALLVLVWGLTAQLIRPGIYDKANTATFIILGVVLCFSGVALVSLHQRILLWPLAKLTGRPTERGLAARLALAYPTAKAFRTASMLGMYSLVVLVIVLMAQIKAVIAAGVDQAVVDATGGWTMRLDSNRAAPVTPVQLRRAGFGRQIAEVASLSSAATTATDPLNRHPDVDVTAIGVSAPLLARPPLLQDRLKGYPDDRSVWRLVAGSGDYILIDSFYGATGGPQGKTVAPGQVIDVAVPGGHHRFTVAGVIKNGLSFYGLTGNGFRYPVLIGEQTLARDFATEAVSANLLLRLARGVTPDSLGPQLQGAFLSDGAVAVDLEKQVRTNYTANTRLFSLMQGYLALGLLVGVCGLGVVMVRAVRERRRTIGVLRALGFRAATVRRSLLTESAVIATQGVVIGAVLGVLTTWLLYRYSPTFGNTGVRFPISWWEILGYCGATVLASFLVTLLPARRAAHIRPAVAVRVAD